MPMMKMRFRKSAALLGCLVALAGMAATPADARRGGSFGSRGSRTYYAPRATSITPYQAAPVQRSMTDRPVNPAANPWRSPAYPSAAYPQGQSPRRFGGFGSGLVGGLLAGGLIGAMMGHGGWGMGYGGMGGGLLLGLVQLLLLGGLIWFAVGLFRGRSSNASTSYFQRDPAPFAAGAAAPAQSPWDAPAAEPMIEIAVTDDDKAAFERMLGEVQDAFAREDYGRLRELTTPEIMSYLSEELSQNATSGRRNEVRNTRLIDAEVAEAWRESGADYATIAMRYESIDVMRDRSTGAVVSGDPATPSQTTEVWTFVRPMAGVWKLAAIQE
jgi:predicted lipid-binding transport protein (Tim44 family)